MRRHRRSKSFLFVPLFVDLSPGDPAIARALGKRRAKVLADMNGLVMGKQSNAAFARTVARKYVGDVVEEHNGPLRIAITGGRAPGGEHDLTLDWRTLLDEGILTDPNHLPNILESLRDIRDAAQQRGGVPSIVVDPHLRLPLAALVGWEWNRVRPIALTVEQHFGTADFTITPDTKPADWPDPPPTALQGAGPAVVAVTTGDPIDGNVATYAADVDACEIVHLHAVLAPGQALTPGEILGLARRTVAVLTDVNQRHSHKHLLIKGALRA